MESFFRQHAVWIVVLLAVLGIGAAFSLRPDPPADFTFSNSTEIKTIDPAIVTGQPEGRIVNEIFEGLIGWNAETLVPEPAVAERWEISDDGRIYTFYLRKNATWSKLGADAEWAKAHPVVAEDFVYSFRRFLDPQTANQYASLLYYVVNGENYNRAIVKKGEKVEVELFRKELTGKRGDVLYGVLVEKHEVEVKVKGEEKPKKKVLYYEVEIEGKKRRFATTDDDAEAAKHQAEKCRQIMPDFRTVGIRAKDTHTLEFELNGPVPYFLKLMGFYPLSPVNRECVEIGYPAWVQPENLVSNGPFLLQARRVRDRIRMVKNPNYWDKDNVHLNIIDALAVQSETTALNLYMTGVCDWIPTVPSTVIPDIIKAKRTDFNPKPQLTIYFYEYNVSKPPFDNAKIRKALSLAIDRREIVERVTKAGQIPAERFVPPGITEYDEIKKEHGVSGVPPADPEKVQLEKNRVEARRLLAEAGFPGGKGLAKIELLHNTHDGHGRIAQLIQSHWKSALGINVEIVNKEWASYLADRQQLKYQVCRAGWTGDYVDPNTFLDLFILKSPNNTTGFADKQYDEWIDQAETMKLTSEEHAALEAKVRKQAGWTEAKHLALFREARDLAVQHKRMEVFFKAENRLLDEQVIIPLYYYVSTSLVRPYVSGYYQNLQDHHPLKGIRVDAAARAEMLSTGKARE